MFIYGRSASNAIAIISYLAEAAPARVGSATIAKARNISPVLTAKLLTQLAAAGMLTGQPGPGGGYTLAIPADRIRLIDIVTIFEQLDETSPCPFGSTWCGSGEPCPLHHEIHNMIGQSRKYLEETRLSVFSRSPQPTKGPAATKRPAKSPRSKPGPKRRGC